MGQRSDAAGVDDSQPSSLPRVLVVDDDPATRTLLTRVLARRQLAVREAVDGQSALAAVAAGDVDVVLLDTGLPDLSGLEVLRRLRAEPATATLPVIVFTGRAHPADRVEGLEAGASDYLAKPVDLDELVARVRAQLRGRDRWRSQITEVLHQRAALAGAIAALPEGRPPEETGAGIVGELVKLDGIRSAGLVRIAGDGSGVTVAGSDLDRHGMAIGSAIPSSGVAELLQSATGRDDVLAQTSVLSLERSRQTHPEVGGDIVVGALGPRHEPWGLLLLETEAGPREETLRRVGAAAVDLIPVVERVLGPVLAHWSGRAESEELAAVIDERAFTPHFQPLVRLGDGTIVGYEALTRFHDGTAPDRRFAQAARIGLGHELELATLDAALEAAAALPADTYLSVNVSASLVTSGRLRGVVAGHHGRPLVLEVTEHERVEDYDAVRHAMQDLGPDVRLSVDDAGSGWASLRHVLALHPDYVKLDRGWVCDIDQDQARQALLLGIARFVELMDGAVVAEGIETSGELATVRALGIPLGQGYLLQRPAPLEAHLGRTAIPLPGPRPSADGTGRERAAGSPGAAPSRDGHGSSGDGHGSSGSAAVLATSGRGRPGASMRPERDG